MIHFHVFKDTDTFQPVVYLFGTYWAKVNSMDIFWPIYISNGTLWLLRAQLRLVKWSHSLVSIYYCWTWIWQESILKTQKINAPRDLLPVLIFVDVFCYFPKGTPAASAEVATRWQASPTCCWITWSQFSWKTLVVKSRVFIENSGTIRTIYSWLIKLHQVFTNLKAWWICDIANGQNPQLLPHQIRCMLIWLTHQKLMGIHSR